MKLRQIKKPTYLPSQQIKQMHYEATLAHSGIAALEDRVSYLDDGFQNLAYTLNNLDQYMREWNILIRGLKNLPRRRDHCSFDEFEFEFIDFLCHELNKHLGSHLIRPLQPDDVERAHVLYQGTKNDNPVVIMRFVRRVVRNNVFFKRKHLKGTNISISDHLTKANLSLLDKAKNAFGMKNTWTSMSKVFVNVGGRRFSIKSTIDITNIMNSQSYPPHSLITESSIQVQQIDGATTIANNVEGNHPSDALSNTVTSSTNDASPNATMSPSVPPKKKGDSKLNSSVATKISGNLNSKYNKKTNDSKTRRRYSQAVLSNKPDLRYNK